MPIVMKSDGVWRRLSGVQHLPVKGEFFTTRRVTYLDGRQPADESCDPYPVREQVSIEKAEAVWGEADWSRYDGVIIASPFAAPDGKRVVGAPRYEEQEDGSVAEVYDVEDIPPPPPPPTLEERLGASGVTLDEIAAALAARQVQD